MQTFLVGDGAARECDIGSGTAAEYAAAGRAAGYAARLYGRDWIVLEARGRRDALDKAQVWDRLPPGLAGLEAETFLALVRSEEGRAQDTGGARP